MLITNAEGCLAISGTLDIDAAPQLRDALLDLLRQPIRIDLAEVDSCDAAAFQLLLAARRHAAFVAVSSAVAETSAALGISFEPSGPEPYDAG